MMLVRPMCLDPLSHKDFPEYPEEPRTPQFPAPPPPPVIAPRREAAEPTLPLPPTSDVSREFVVLLLAELVRAYSELAERRGIPQTS